MNIFTGIVLVSAMYAGIVAGMIIFGLVYRWRTRRWQAMHGHDPQVMPANEAVARYGDVLGEIADLTGPIARCHANLHQSTRVANAGGNHG